LILSQSYQNQMKLKILSSLVVDTNDYCILDAKNFFVNEWQPSHIWDETGRLVADFDDQVFSVWQSGAKASFDFFGVEYSNSRFYFKNLTPFFIQRKIVKEIAENSNLWETWTGNAELVEFYLINAAIEKTLDFNKLFFQSGRHWQKTVWPGDTSRFFNLTIEQIKSELFYECKDMLCLGLHRQCFLLCEGKIIEAFAQIWEELGLAKRFECLELIDQMKKYNLTYENGRLK
jgi:hypothetical protein